MKHTYKFIIVGLFTILLILLMLYIYGLTTPENHEANRTILIAAPFDTVWALLSDHSTEVLWRTDLESIVRMDDRDGNPVWREVYSSGEGMLMMDTEILMPLNSIMTDSLDQSITPYQLIEGRLVREIVDEGMGFGGTWTITVLEVAEGTRVQVVENGYIDSPFFRAVMHIFYSPTDTIDRYLEMLAGYLGTELQVLNE